MAEGQAIGGSRKVTVPAGGPAILSRARLEERLDEARRRRLTLVTAGHGWGKTALLAAWARRRNAAWYTVGPEDRDPAVLVRHVATGTETLFLGDEEILMSSTRPPAP